MLGFRVGVDTLGLPPGTSHEFTKRQPGSLPGDGLTSLQSWRDLAGCSLAGS